MSISIGKARGTIVAGCALVALSSVTGCGGPPEDLPSSNRGGGSHTADTSVENAFIVPRFVPGSCAIQVGDVAELRFTVTNNRPTGTERLLGVSAPAAESVRIEPAPPLEIPAGKSIAAGQPATPGEQFNATMVDVNDTLQPALPTDVVFSFEEFGELSMPVGVEACPTQPE